MLRRILGIVRGEGEASDGMHHSDTARVAPPLSPPRKAPCRNLDWVAGEGSRSSGGRRQKHPAAVRSGARGDEGEFRIGHLAACGFSSQLEDRFEGVVQAMDVALGQ